jgi:predicted metal-dependent phosphoesterase TrpH
MKTKASPLLCEFHAHTTWSDGAFSVGGVVDLYGRNGFDVLAITDHAPRDAREVHPGNHAAYLEELEREAERAWRLYRLLVLPGLELTYDDPDPLAAAHAVAVGLRTCVDVARGVEQMLRAARAHGAALVAAHPYSAAEASSSARRTARFAADHERLAQLVDRFELFNRHTLFGWVAEAGLPTVANGDFHRVEHLGGWKTMLPCVKEEAAVVDYLRSGRPTYLVRLDERPALRAA